MYKIVLDTNVIVSALYTKNSESNTVKTISLIGMKNFSFYYSDKILSEYKEVLNRKEFGFRKEKIEKFINDFLDIAIKVNEKQINILIYDEKDIPFYNVYETIKSDNTFLITGNVKDFPKEKNIVTPKEFIDNVYNKI